MGRASCWSCTTRCSSRHVHGVARTTPKGRTLGALQDAGCALLTAHTNADQAVGGVSEALATALGLTDLRPITAGATSASTS